jgi:hypothetical protein
MEVVEILGCEGGHALLQYNMSKHVPCCTTCLNTTPPTFQTCKLIIPRSVFVTLFFVWVSDAWLGAASLLLQRVLKLVLVENTVVVRIRGLEHPNGTGKQALARAHLLSWEGADGVHAMHGHLPS